MASSTCFAEGNWNLQSTNWEHYPGCVTLTHTHTRITHNQKNVWLVRSQECIWTILKDHIQPPIRSWGSGAAAWGMGIISFSVYPLGRSLHSTSTSPSAWCLTALCNISVCSTHRPTLALVLKWPHLCSAHTGARPFVFFRCNTVIRSAVSHHSRWSGFFSPASDVGTAGCEEVVDPPGSTLDYCFLWIFCSRNSSGGSPACTPLAEAGSWAVLAAESALAFAVLEGG